MMEKIYEEFVVKPWDRDEDYEEKEKMEDMEKCIERIKEILDGDWEANEKVLEIESVIKSLE
jgi:hypothetical protein